MYRRSTQQGASAVGRYLIKTIKIDNFLNDSIRTLFIKVSNQDFPQDGAGGMLRVCGSRSIKTYTC
jgi:hypothetical protein